MPRGRLLELESELLEVFRQNGHRGQICWLARELGHEFHSEDTMRLWGWKALPPINAGSRKVGAR
jgi:hypothetical protein